MTFKLGPTCECGHARSRHRIIADGRIQYARCLGFGCGCPHYVAKRVCTSCAGLGIRFDAPVRVVQALTAVGVEVNHFELTALADDTVGRVLVGTWIARVTLDRPGIEAVRQLESRLNRHEWEVDDDARALADLMLDAGQWLCPCCYGHGIRRLREAR